jgi:hypothetical protein
MASQNEDQTTATGWTAVHQKTSGHTNDGDTPAGSLTRLRTKEDDLSAWETIKRRKLITAVAMCAAFSSSLELDGYRESFIKPLPLLTLQRFFSSGFVPVQQAGLSHYMTASVFFSVSALR